MYKHAGRNLQRRSARVVEARPPTSVYITPDDLVSDSGSMTLAQCLAERAQILLQKAQAENELQAQKRRGRAAHGIGMRISAFCTRLAALNQRITELKREGKFAELMAFQRAARELLPARTFDRLLARAGELMAEDAASIAQENCA